MKHDPRQFVMLAVFAVTSTPALSLPVPPDVARDFAEADADREFRFVGSKMGWSDDERAAWSRSWDRGRRQHDRGEAAVAAGQIEVLAWGAAVAGMQTAFGKPGYQLQLWNDYGRWRTRMSLDVYNQGQSSPYSSWYFASREEAMVDAFRRIIDSAAHERAQADGWPDAAKRAKQYAGLVRWCIDQAPPMLVGCDLQAEYEAACRTAVDQVAQSRERAREVGAVRQSVAIAIYRQGEGPYVGPDLSGSRSIMDHSEGLDWHERFVGEYHVAGTVPGGLEVVLYTKDGQPHPVVDQALERIRAAVDVPARMATAAEQDLCHADRSRVRW